MLCFEWHQRYKVNRKTAWFGYKKKPGGHRGGDDPSREKEDRIVMLALKHLGEPPLPRPSMAGRVEPETYRPCERRAAS